MNLSHSQIQAVADIAEKNQLILALLYGSRSMGNSRPDSDFDIAVLGRVKISLKIKYAIQVELASVLGASVDKIDLVDINTVSPLLLYQIVRDGQLLFGDERIYDNFYRQAHKQYIDAKKILKATETYVKERTTG